MTAHKNVISVIFLIIFYYVYQIQFFLFFCTIYETQYYYGFNSYRVKPRKSYDPKFVTDEWALDYNNVASLTDVYFLDHDLCYGAAALP